MIITTTMWPANLSITCPNCTALGYTTTVQTQQGDVTLIQTMQNGVVSGLIYSGQCPACGYTMTGTITIAALKTATAKTHPGLLSPIVQATLAGIVYTPPSPPPIS